MNKKPGYYCNFLAFVFNFSMIYFFKLCPAKKVNIKYY